jgi:hypothetical protein
VVIGFAGAKRFVTEGAFVFMIGRRGLEVNRAAEMLRPNAVAGGVGAQEIQGFAAHKVRANHLLLRWSKAGLFVHWRTGMTGTFA